MTINNPKLTIAAGVASVAVIAGSLIRDRIAERKFDRQLDEVRLNNTRKAAEKYARQIVAERMRENFYKGDLDAAIADYELEYDNAMNFFH